MNECLYAVTGIFGTLFLVSFLGDCGWENWTGLSLKLGVGYR